MSFSYRTITAAALSLGAIFAFSAHGSAKAADVPVKAVKAKAVQEVPFFFVIDDRVSYSYIFNAAQPGAYTVRPNGTVVKKAAAGILPCQ